MEQSELVRGLFVVLGIILGNYAAIRVLTSKLTGLEDRFLDRFKRVDDELDHVDKQIKELYERTRFVMTDFQIREAIRLELATTRVDIKELKAEVNDVIKAVTVIKARCNGCNTREGDRKDEY